MSPITLDPKSLTVWEANMRELRRLQPRLAQALDKWTETNGHSFEHEETATPKGFWVSGLTEEPFFQPAEIPEKPWRRGEESRVSILFVYGTGVAPWLFRMVRSLPETALAIVVLEPNIALLSYLLHTTSIYHALPAGCRISFIVDSAEASVEEALMVNVMQLGTYVASLARIWIHPGEEEVFRPRLEEIQKALRERVITKLQELGNSAEDTLLGLRQIALSAPWMVLSPSLSSITQQYRGRPFIWVASGPSLDKNVHLLKENADRSVIICADTAVRKLLGMGIVPHIAVALERGVPVYQYLEKIWIQYPEEAKKILLVSQAVCVPEVAGKWPGPKIVVGKREIPVDNWMIGEILKGDVVFSGLSVAHMGIWLAAYMGASSLALIGQDLAFGEGRRSHAGATVTAQTAKAEAEGDYRVLKRDYEVPGALGGTVLTHEMWFLFLRVMERFVPMLGLPVFDCTEGGALIRGTTIEPLMKWMTDHLGDVKSFERSPAEHVASLSRTPEERRAAVGRVVHNVGLAIAFVRDSRKKLDKLEEEIGRTTAPGLSPQQRKVIAANMATLLDEFHHSNPVIDFIGQSQVTLNAAVITETRHLDDIFAVQEWKRVHEEIIAGHRSSLDFMENWLKYMAISVDIINENWDKGFSVTPLPFFPTGSVRDLNPFEADLMVNEAMEQIGLLSRAETEMESLSAHVLLDNLIARADHKWWHFWDDRIDWKLGLSLEEEGRSAEAILFLQRMENQSMGIFGLPHEAGVAFLKDSARIVASNDMCYIPDFDRARLYVQNVIDLEPGDEGARDLLKDINARALRYYTNLSAMALDPSKVTPQRIANDWHLERTKAEQAIADEDVLLAFELVWAMIKKFLLVVPEGASDYLEWLTTQIVRLEEQETPPERVVEIRREILKWMPLIRELKMKMNPNFAPAAETVAQETLKLPVTQGIEV